MTPLERIILRLKESRDLLDMVTRDSNFAESLSALSVECTSKIEDGGKLVFFGNGGSAGDAQHLAAEFVGRYLVERKPIPAVALTTNSSVLTAISNDYDYSSVFSRQVEALVGKGDVAFGISTSGDSKNVVKGLEEARALGATTVSFSGNSGGKVSKISDYCFIVPSDSTPLIQQMHITIGHILCELIELSL
tara:strand:- start:771 stop:1346 length:576 start_codon:yes stop_codon:yes gene_type:complete